MTTVNTPSPLALVPSLQTAWQDVDSSFERFCLTAGIGAIEQMLCEDAQRLAGTPHIVAEAASATAGARPRARSASMAAMLRFIARGYVALTAMNFRYRLGRRRRPRTGLAAGR